MRLKNLDLFAAMLIVAINVGWTQLPNRPVAIGVLLALPLILILPGYMLTQTLLRRRSSAPDPASNLLLRPSLNLVQPVGTIDRVILSLGLSMAIDILIGFMLNILPIGLQGLSWTVSLGLVTTVFTLFSAFLRRKHRMEDEKKPRLRLTIYEFALFGLAVLVASAAIWLSVIRPPATQSYFTQFWMLPSNQKADNCAVQVGVQNFEATTMTYRVIMTVNGVQVSRWSSIALAPQERWNHSVPISLSTSTIYYVDAKLYKLDEPQMAYREAHITINSSGEGKDRKLQC